MSSLLFHEFDSFSVQYVADLKVVLPEIEAGPLHQRLVDLEQRHNRAILLNLRLALGSPQVKALSLQTPCYNILDLSLTLS